MTDDEAIALGRRAVAARRWRWMPGMRAMREWAHGTVEPVRVHAHDEIADNEVDPDHVSDATLPARPDLRDPATLGCLLALVREAYGPAAFAGYAFALWRAWRCTLDAVDWYEAQATGGETDPERGPLSVGASEVEALVVALETAP